MIVCKRLSCSGNLSSQSAIVLKSVASLVFKELYIIATSLCLVNDKDNKYTKINKFVIDMHNKYTHTHTHARARARARSSEATV